MKIGFVRSNAISNWFTVERTDVKPRFWIERVENELGGYSQLCSSLRISDADVEGTEAEMIAIARAVIDGQSISFRRCATSTNGDKVMFWSPRNSQHPGEVPREEAVRAAKEFLREHVDLGKKDETGT